MSIPTSVVPVFQVKALLHAADISNPIRPFSTAKALSERVHQEFAQQAEECRGLGLPVAPHMDVADSRTRAKMEVQFIDYVVGPLWERLAQVFPSLQPCVTQMKCNRQCFADMEKAGVAADSASPQLDHQSGGNTSDQLSVQQPEHDIVDSHDGVSVANTPTGRSLQGQVEEDSEQELPTFGCNLVVDVVCAAEESESDETGPGLEKCESPEFKIQPAPLRPSRGGGAPGQLALREACGGDTAADGKAAAGRGLGGKATAPEGRVFIPVGRVSGNGDGSSIGAGGGAMRLSLTSSGTSAGVSSTAGSDKVQYL